MAEERHESWCVMEQRSYWIKGGLHMGGRILALLLPAFCIGLYLLLEAVDWGLCLAAPVMDAMRRNGDISLI